MNARAGTWVIVLVAGDGTRLSTLTTDERGEVVPKQFCSLNGGPTLLQQALQRARHIVPRAQVCVIVARKHELHWHRLLRSFPATNVIVQPSNRGTATGVLLGLLSILERAPLARILFLPADHYVRDEELLACTMRTEQFHFRGARADPARTRPGTHAGGRRRHDDRSSMVPPRRRTHSRARCALRTPANGRLLPRHRAGRRIGVRRQHAPASPSTQGNE